MTEVAEARRCQAYDPPRHPEDQCTAEAIAIVRTELSCGCIRKTVRTCARHLEKATREGPVRGECRKCGPQVTTSMSEPVTL